MGKFISRAEVLTLDIKLLHAHVRYEVVHLELNYIYMQGWHILRIKFKKSSPADKIGLNWRKLDKSGENWRKLDLRYYNVKLRCRL